MPKNVPSELFTAGLKELHGAVKDNWLDSQPVFHQKA
jgi:hypothetical protein